MYDINAELQKIIALQDEAYAGPTCSFWQRWIPGYCRHSRIRCTHGDEIIARNFRRRVCMVCGRSLIGPLPIECFFLLTKEVHPSYANR